jgi:iron complex transport system ATP-binding protein
MRRGIALDGVTVAYGGTEVVHDVTLRVEEGEWLTLIGPNGAGKSTLLRTIVGTPPAAGEVLVGGTPIATARHRHRARMVAYVPQQPVFPEGLSVFDYVLLGRTPHMGFLASESSHDIGEVWEALDVLELTVFAGRDVSTLSGGEFQRVAMARVLAQDAPVLVLDEATASLDVARQHQVLELVDAIRRDRGLTVVAAMHDLTAAAQFSDRVALMDAGAIRAVGPPSHVLTEHELREVYEPSIRVLDVDGSIVVVSMRDTAG